MDANGDTRATRTVAATPAAERAERRSVARRFDLIRRLGGGGQGEVWLAEDRLVGQRVAVKLIHCSADGAARARLTQEARVGRQLSHPNLVRVFDLLDEGDTLVVVMEWAPGGSLKQRLRDGPLPVAEVVDIASQVLGALACLHGHGIVHRDVKPSNLLVDATGRVKLADLGLVRDVGAGGDLTRTGASVGTPNYMSPEQLRGEAVGAATDLFALGVTLYELLTGVRPFDGGSDWETANRHLAARAVSPRRARPECPRWLASFILRLLEKDSRHRWSDAAAAAEALLRRFAPRWRLWRRVATVAAVVASLAVGGWGARSALFRGRLVSASIRNGEVVAIGESGSELWRRGFARSPLLVLVGDLLGTASPEVAVGLGPDEPGPEGSRSEIVVLDAAGDVVERLAMPGPGEVSEAHRRFSADSVVGGLGAHDLDGDGRDELVWRVSHPDWYPEVVGVWWGHGSGALQPLFANSGRVHNYEFTDVDGDGAPELVVVGVNNPMGYQGFVAVADVTGRAVSPDMFVEDDFSSLVSYVPLGLGDGAPSVAVSPAGDVELRASSETFRLVRGVPVPSPAGLDARRWMRFWSDLETLCRNVCVDPATGLAGRRSFAAAHAAVLAASPARVAYHLLLARALAQVGANRDAVEVLRDGVKADPDGRDLWLRMGEQLLILGQRDDGRRALVRSLLGVGIGRGAFDASEILELDAALHDGDGGVSVREAYSATGFRDRIGERLAPVRAFFRGDWDAPAFSADEDYRVFKSIAVMRLWAGLESGQPAAAIAAAAVPLEANPEIADPARLLRAAALLRIGDAAGSERLARAALAHLERDGRESFEAFVWVPVAEWVYGAVLSAAGREREARDHLARAVALAPGAWFARRRGQVTAAARPAPRP